MSRSPRRILIGYDGSDCAHRALELAASLVQDGTSVTLATVAEVMSFGIPDPFSTAEQKRLLTEGKELLAARGVASGSIEPLDADAAEGLVWAAKKVGADLLVVGTHSRGRLARLALGSVAGAVVHRAPCSVLVVP
jgi:nucleotide-binding universal stress UspA family protein